MERSPTIFPRVEGVGGRFGLSRVHRVVSVVHDGCDRDFRKGDRQTDHYRTTAGVGFTCE